MTDYEALDHLIGKETRLLEKRIEELTRERDEALATVDAYVERIQVQQEHLDKARAVVRSADRFCRCLGEFGAEGIGYCSEWLEALESALLNYSGFEAKKALEAE